MKYGIEWKSGLRGIEMLIKFKESVPFQNFETSEIHVSELTDFYHDSDGNT